MSDQTYNLTQEDIRKELSRESKAHGGSIPADSDAAGLQSIVDSAGKDKAAIIEERKANLPLPDQPPVASDFNTADGSGVSSYGGGKDVRNVEVSGGALRGPATGDSDVRTDAGVFKTNVQGSDVGRAGVDGIPNDAVAQGSKNKAGLEDTTNADKGYPQKSDPSAGVQ